MQTIIHEIEKDGIPDMLKLKQGQVAFLFNGTIITGRPSGDSPHTWEAYDFGRDQMVEYNNVTYWLEYPIEMLQIEAGVEIAPLLPTQHFTATIVENAQEAIDRGYDYNKRKPMPEGLKIKEAVVVRAGMASGQPTVDLIMEDRYGSEYVVMTTGNLLAMLPLRNFDNPRH